MQQLINYKQLVLFAFAHGGQPWQDATVFEAVALGIGGNNYYKNCYVNLEENCLRSETTVKVFDQMRKLANYTDPGSPGRDWNVATGMVIEGKAGFQIMGDWAKGEFTAAGKITRCGIITVVQLHQIMDTCTMLIVLYSIKLLILTKLKVKNYWLNL